MTRVYRSPTSGSAAAATTPARLAREFDSQVRWRERPGEEIEVAILRDGRVDRCLVDEDGSTTLLASSPPSSASLWGKPVFKGPALRLQHGRRAELAKPRAPHGVGGCFALWMTCDGRDEDVPLEGVQLNVVDSAHRRRPWHVAQERDLTEVTPRTEPPRRHAVDENLDLPLRYHVEPV